MDSRGVVCAVLLAATVSVSSAQDAKPLASAPDDPRKPAAN